MPESYQEYDVLTLLLKLEKRFSKCPNTIYKGQTGRRRKSTTSTSNGYTIITVQYQGIHSEEMSTRSMNKPKNIPSTNLGEYETAFTCMVVDHLFGNICSSSREQHLGQLQLRHPTDNVLHFLYTTFNTAMKLPHLTITITPTRPARRTLMGRGSEEPAKTSDTTVVIREEFVFILVN